MRTPAEPGDRPRILCVRTQAFAWALGLIALWAIAARTAKAQTYQVLYTFTGESDGAGPSGPVIRDSAGNLYGTAGGGGKFGAGVVYKLSPAGAEKVLHSFTGILDGAGPTGALVRDQAGDLYGTASGGGEYGMGTVFKLGPKGDETVLHSFFGIPDGADPTSGLAADSEGNMYGVTLYGGSTISGFGPPGGGTAFKVYAKGDYAVLYAFSYPNGIWPFGGLVVRDSGAVYGTTTQGEDTSNYGGSVFEITPLGQVTMLYGFSDTAEYLPYAGLEAHGAYLYGTTTSGEPPYLDGTVFKLDSAGNLTVLHTFSGPDGSQPYAPVVADGAGNLYGTTTAGGAYGFGTVFEIDSAGNETVLHSFTGGGDGADPRWGLLLYEKTLFGTASSGGSASCSCGVVFAITL